ncbi:F-box/kelch-repeat protein At1g15670-like [Cryptomeria japonica]|uniref:F-box/kelch-repeat protein At1g15670-like n=1 Tax=Cryptomeria japonica TaxID=3369 RepID=UPI0027D9EB83|nr:F-box/kelch-repeat protein At1g15670-like [Cryptomeria japonica]
MWKAIIESGKIYKERISSGLSDKLVCFLDQSDDCNRMAVYDLVHYSVATSPSMPSKFQFTKFSHCLCVDQKLILLGLQYENQPTGTTMVFDFMSCRWKKGAEIPIDKFGYQLACCASPERLVYIAGRSKKAAVYDVGEDKWELLPEMSHSISWARGYYIDGMFRVVTIYGTLNYLSNPYNPVAKQWEVLQRFELLRYTALSFVADSGHIYSFGEHNVMEFDCLRKLWMEAGNPPSHLNWLGSTESHNNIFQFVTRKTDGSPKLGLWSNTSNKTNASPKFELYDDDTLSELCNDATLAEFWDETLSELPYGRMRLIYGAVG